MHILGEFNFRLFMFSVALKYWQFLNYLFHSLTSFGNEMRVNTRRRSLESHAFAGGSAQLRGWLLVSIISCYEMFVAGERSTF
jgi:hypothetical protein